MGHKLKTSENPFFPSLFDSLSHLSPGLSVIQVLLPDDMSFHNILSFFFILKVVSGQGKRQQQYHVSKLKWFPAVLGLRAGACQEHVNAGGWYDWNLP